MKYGPSKPTYILYLVLNFKDGSPSPKLKINFTVYSHPKMGKLIIFYLIGFTICYNNSMNLKLVLYNDNVDIHIKVKRSYFEPLDRVESGYRLVGYV